ncbi:MAG: MarR family transcriptional regulator [Synergistaceae bacterium]|jgi:predicted transcriptional regulator|nr:MarR family transcriptional regulator [Synergistaceae bacterium]
MLDKDKAVEIIERIRTKHGLKIHEVTALAVILFASDGTGECSITVGDIAELCGRSKSSVRRAIRSLEEKGLLIREEQYYEDEENARAPNKYTLRIGG